MFACFFKSPVTTSQISPLYPGYTAAGCLFVEGPVALAGVQKQFLVSSGKRAPVLSGLGGRREDGDLDWIHTALRETVEELFDVKDVPVALLNRLRLHLPIRHAVEVDGYVLAQYSFDDLSVLLRLCTSLQSPLYKVQPRTVHDLITKRCVGTSEIGSLALVPRLQGVTVDAHFEGDLVATKKN
jgi:hypothetical protein